MEDKKTWNQFCFNSYRFGNGGRQDGAQYGPIASYRNCSTILNSLNVEWTFTEIVKDTKLRVNHIHDGLITTDDRTKVVPYSASELKKNKSLSNPKGVKNLEYLLPALKSLTAHVTRELLVNLIYPHITNLPFTIGGDHSQGFGTVKGVMLGKTVEAILSGKLPLHGAKINNRDPQSIRSQLLDIVTSLSNSKKEKEIIRLCNELGLTIANLIDFEAFSSISNAAVLKLKKSHAYPDLSFQDIRSQCIKQLESSEEDKGILKVSDLKQFLSRVHVLWFDAHADFNDDQSSETKNFHGMPGACVSGFGNESLKSIFNTWWAEMNPEGFHVVGARDTDQRERRLMKDTGVDLWRMREIEQSIKRRIGRIDFDYALRSAFDEIFHNAKSSCKMTGVEPPIFVGSFDLDGMHMNPELPSHSFESGPKSNLWVLATGTPVNYGPKRNAVYEALHGVIHDPCFVAADLTEFSPTLNASDPEYRTIDVHSAMFLSMLTPSSQQFIYPLPQMKLYDFETIQIKPNGSCAWSIPNRKAHQSSVELPLNELPQIQTNSSKPNQGD